MVLCPSVELPFVKGVGYSRLTVLTVGLLNKIVDACQNLLLSKIHFWDKVSTRKSCLYGKSLVCLCSF